MKTIFNKALVVLGLTILLFQVGFAQPIVQVTHEVVADVASTSIYGITDYPSGCQTYRVYAEMSNGNSVMQAVLGISDVLDMSIGTSSGYVWNFDYIFQVTGTLGEDVLESVCFGLIPFQSWYFDSWVTIGTESDLFPVGQEPLIAFSGSLGVDYNIDENLFWGSDDYLEPNNSLWTATNSGWLLGNVDAPNAYGIGPNLRVVLAQITTNGDVAYRLNLSALSDIPVNGGTTYFYVWDGDVLPAGLSGVEVDGSNLGLVYPGFNCNMPDACNYNQFLGFEVDNSYCDYNCYGCIDPSSCNFSEGVYYEDGSCTDEYTCGYEFADNYDPAAECSDFSLCIIGGCMDPSFCNYLEIATYDNGSCITGTCSNPIADNYDPDFECSNSSECVIGGCTDQNFCNYSYLATYDNETCEDLVSCTDPDAVNYDPDPVCFGSCLYAGCSNPEAINFDPFASGDNSLCVYGILGVVYLDNNENGVQDVAEPGIENWTIDIPSIGICTFTSDGGEFSFSGVPAGTYDVVILNNDDWSNTTPTSVSLTISEDVSGSADFGIVPLSDDYSFFNAQECCIFLPWIHCDDGFFPGVWFTNAGTANLNGTISLSWDPILDAEFQFGAVVPDVLTDGYCEWQLDEYTPGSSDIFRIHIIGPGFEFMGQNFDFDISFDFEDFNGEEFFSSGILLNPEVVCAYDPNDKYAEPEGYSEEHFILPDERIQYRIRFQNTGNFPASQVVVRDTLSPLLDFNSFQPMFSSHNMNTTFNLETGEIEFAFYNINLPDSTNNEEESHGFLVFEIDPLDGLEMGDVIENTGHIYFDGNPAVVTNTTWHTIYECTSGLSEFNLDAPNTCVGSEIFGSTNTEYIEDYLWEINGAVQIDAEDEMTYVLPAAQEYEVTFIASNPICEQTSSQIIEAFDNPIATITGDSEYCEGETISLLGAGADEYNWGGLGDEQNLSFTAENDETISLTVTDDNGCSDEVTLEIIVNPLPDPIVSESDFILTSNVFESYQWYDQNGEISDATNMTYLVTQDGQYYVEVIDENGCSEVSDIIDLVYIGINEIGSEIFKVYPVPAINTLTIDFLNNEDYQVQLYSLDGKLVEDFGIQNGLKTKISLDNIESGNYNLIIKNENRIWNTRVLVIK